MPSTEAKTYISKAFQVKKRKQENLFQIYSFDK